jgi:hypothetical protein
MYILLVLTSHDFKMKIWNPKQLQIKSQQLQSCYLIEIYNFDVGDFAIRGRLTNLNFKLSKLQPYCWDIK